MPEAILIRALEPNPAVFVSALDPDSLTPLRETLRARMRARLDKVRVRLPASDGETLARLYREGEVVDRVDEDGSVVVLARLPEAEVGRLGARDDIEIQEAE